MKEKQKGLKEFLQVEERREQRKGDQEIVTLLEDTVKSICNRKSFQQVQDGISDDDEEYQELCLEQKFRYAKRLRTAADKLVGLATSVGFAVHEIVKVKKEKQEASSSSTCLGPK